MTKPRTSEVRNANAQDLQGTTEVSAVIHAIVIISVIMDVIIIVVAFSIQDVLLLVIIIIIINVTPPYD